MHFFYRSLSRTGTSRTGSIASRLLNLSAVLIVIFIMVPRSQASWTAFSSTGTTTGIGNPSCAPVSSEHVACAVLSEKSAMMVNEYSGTKWGTWKVLTGAVASSPSCTSDGAGKVFCAATAATGSLEVAILSGTTWDTPTDVTASLYSAPSCAEYIVSEVLCVARNSAGGLAWSLYSGNKWSTFANLTTTAVSAPNCTSDHSSGVICSFVSIAGVTELNRFVAGSWKGFVNIGGIAGGVPSCTYWKPNGETACFVKATENGEIYVSTFSGGTWSASNWTTYGALGGVANDNAAARARPPMSSFVELSVQSATMSFTRMSTTPPAGRVGPQSAARELARRLARRTLPARFYAC